MNGSTLYLAGVPVNPSAAALMARWPEIKPGDEIGYAEIEDVAGVRRGSKRWVTVTNRWRAWLIRERGVRLGCVGGRAFVALDDARVIGGAVGYFKRGQRNIATSVQWAGAAKPEALDEVGKRHRDHLLTAGAKLLAAGQASLAKLDDGPALPRPVREQRKLKG